MIRDFWRDTRGATAIEYVLIATFVSVVIVAGAASIGNRLSTRYFTPIAGNLT